MNPSEKLFIINTLFNEGYEKLLGSSRWVRVEDGKEFENMYRAYEDYILNEDD
jgi:hypothetical protein